MLEPGRASEPTNEQGKERSLFFRRWLANPLRVGALAPSSASLSRHLARATVVGVGEAVIDLGAGTGPVTAALVEQGVPEDRVLLIESDSDLCAFLRERFSKAKVIHGDAADLVDIVPSEWQGRVATVISGVPMVNLPPDVRAGMVDAAFRVMKPGGRLLQYTYSLFSPLPRKELRLKGWRAAFTGTNLPPAHVWVYTRPDQVSGVSARR